MSIEQMLDLVLNLNKIEGAVFAENCSIVPDMLHSDIQRVLTQPIVNLKVLHEVAEPIEYVFTQPIVFFSQTLLVQLKGDE